MAESDREGAEQRAIRHALEAQHHRADKQAVDLAWQHLGHRDRFLRFAARVALARQEPDVALAHGALVVECPITFHARVGVSKGGNVDNWRGLTVGLKMIKGITFGWKRRAA